MYPGSRGKLSKTFFFILITNDWLCEILYFGPKIAFDIEYIRKYHFFNSNFQPEIFFAFSVYWYCKYFFFELSFTCNWNTIKMCEHVFFLQKNENTLILVFLLWNNRKHRYFTCIFTHPCVFQVCSDLSLRYLDV